MPWIPNVVAGAPIASSWGNAIRDASVLHFATTADRDSSWPTPPTGATCYVIDIATLFSYDGTAWREVSPPMGAMRVLREVIRTGDSGNIGTTNTAVPGQILNFTPVAGRLYYVAFGCRIAVSAANVGILFTMNGPPGVGGTGYTQNEAWFQSASWFEWLSPVLGLTPGTATSLTLVARTLTTSQYHVHTGAANRPGYLQLLERIPAPGTTLLLVGEHDQLTELPTEPPEPKEQTT